MAEDVWRSHKYIAGAPTREKAKEAMYKAMPKYPEGDWTIIERKTPDPLNKNVLFEVWVETYRMKGLLPAKLRSNEKRYKFVRKQS